MRTLAYYLKAIKLCERMEEAGSLSIQLPERHIFLSTNLKGDDRNLAVEAVSAYVRVYDQMSLAVSGLKIVSVILLAISAYQLLS